MKTALFLYIFFIATAPVFAYLDPGTGSFFLQILLAFLFGSLFFIKSIWQRIGLFFSQIFGRKNKE